MADLPDPAGYSSDHRLVLDAITPAGRVALELWPGTDGRPTQSPIAMVSMGAFVDDSTLRVAVSGTRMSSTAGRPTSTRSPTRSGIRRLDTPRLVSW